MSGKDDNDDKDKKQESAFPEGYEYLDDLMEQGLERRQEMDKQLEALSKEASKPPKHSLKYAPPGFVTGRPAGNKDFTMGKLEAEKIQMEVSINERIELQLQVMETDPATAQQIRQTVMDKLHPNVFEGKGEKELERLGKSEKDINTSQDYMRAQMKNFREGPPRDPKSPEEINRDAAKTDKDINRSQDFMQRQIAAVKERGAEKAAEQPSTPGKEEARDLPTMLMSERFSQSLSYTKALEKSAEKPSPTKTKEDKSPDKD